MFEASKKDAQVDILMATYNGERFISRQIESILAQTFKNYRLIIADDNSIDGTKDILTSYAMSDPRIELVFNHQNIGIKANFEQLIQMSSSRYFMLADQDDYWHPIKIEISLDKIIRSKATLIYTDLRLIDEKSQLISPSFWENEGYKPVAGQPWRNLLEQNVATGCTFIASHNLIKYTVPFPPNVPMHDWWLVLIASFTGNINYINEALIDYRQHGKNRLGARGGIKGYLTRYTDCYRNYENFLIERNRILGEKLAFLQDCYIYLLKHEEDIKEGREIISVLVALIKAYERFLRIRRIDSKLLGFKIKRDFPSTGRIRNLWWAIFYSLPLFSYIIGKVILMLLKVKLVNLKEKQ